MNYQPTPSGHLVNIAVAQPCRLRKVFETLKDMLGDANISFEPNGIFVKSFDKDGVCVVLLNINASSEFFQPYECNSKKVVRVSIPILAHIMKQVKEDDILKLIVEDENSVKLTLSIQNKQGVKKTFNIKMREQFSNDTDDYMASITEKISQYDVCLHFDSNCFKSYCSDATIQSERLLIEITENNEIIFLGYGQDVDGKVAIASDENNMSKYINCWTDASYVPEVTYSGNIRGIYALSNINHVTKAASLANNTKIFIASKNSEKLENHIALFKYDMEQNYGTLYIGIPEAIQEDNYDTQSNAEIENGMDLN